MIPRLTVHYIHPSERSPAYSEGESPFDYVSGIDFVPVLDLPAWGPAPGFAALTRGQRVVLADAETLMRTGLSGLPPYAWVRRPWGDRGPFEVAWTPPRDWDGEAGSAFWHDLRRFRQARDDAWLAVGRGRYHLAAGDFDGAPVDEIRTALLQGARGLRRFSGHGLDVLSHMNVVRAIVQRRHLGEGRRRPETELARAALVSGLGDALFRRSRGGSIHDAHEPLVCDLPTPLKRIMRAAGDVWDDIERQAQVSVERLFRVVDLTEEDRRAIAEADRAALVAEAHAFGIGVGSWLEGFTVDEDAAEAVAKAKPSSNPYADWEAAWALAGGDP